MKLNYVPNKGDLVQIDVLNSDSSQIQMEKKNALVISPKSYNEKTGLALFCPIKNKTKGYPFEVLIPDESKIKGIILADQLKSMNWKMRNAEFICKLPDDKINEVISKISALI